MIKNYLKYLLLILFISNCGYSPIYSNKESMNFSIDLIKMEGDRNLNETIKTNLNTYNKKSLDKINYKLIIKSTISKKPISKDSKGSITQEKITSNVKFVLSNLDKNYEFYFIEEFNLKKDNDVISEKSYEKNVIKNMGDSFSRKLIAEISRL